MVMTIEEDDVPDDDDVKKQTRIAFKTTCESRSHDMRPRTLDITTCDHEYSISWLAISRTLNLRLQSRPPNNFNPKTHDHRTCDLTNSQPTNLGPLDFSLINKDSKLSCCYNDLELMKPNLTKPNPIILNSTNRNRRSNKLMILTKEPTTDLNLNTCSSSWTYKICMLQLEGRYWDISISQT